MYVCVTTCAEVYEPTVGSAPEIVLVYVFVHVNVECQRSIASTLGIARAVATPMKTINRTPWKNRILAAMALPCIASLISFCSTKYKEAIVRESLSKHYEKNMIES